MNIHEYQAKALLAQYKLPVPKNGVVRALSEVDALVSSLGDAPWVVKAQVHAGGRGKAGGVKVVKTLDAVKDFVAALLKTRLVTYQTDAKGQPVDTILIEEGCAIKKEYYLGAVLDRASQRVVMMASTEGGVEIEKVAQDTPEKILSFKIDPLVGVMPYQARCMGFGLGFKGDLLKQFTKIVIGLGAMFKDCDLSLIEINPLVCTTSDTLICLDAKINGDDNAFYRQPALQKCHDPAQEDPRELHARQWELNYIALEGSIGCMVNGAGLAMATMDIIKLHGGEPANFLDVGGGATKERVVEAFKIILSDTNVKAVLVNIFGGIVRCDLIAEGIIGAVKDVGIQIPVVVRLEGNRASIAQELLTTSGMNIIAAQGLSDAARKVVAAVEEK
jgi:succinyl-CoA synthetase beta subunit